MGGRRALLLYDGTASSLAQCRALAGALERRRWLAPDAVERHVPIYPGIASHIASRLMPAFLKFGILDRPFAGYDAAAVREVLLACSRSRVRTVVACGGRTAGLGVGVKNALLAAGVADARHVQILDPRFGRAGTERHLDAVVTPQHDEGCTGRNVVKTTGALTWVTPAALAAAQSADGPGALSAGERDFVLRGCQGPRLVLLCGGRLDRRNRTFNVDLLLAQLRLADEHNARSLPAPRFRSLLVVLSRRSAADLQARILARSAGLRSFEVVRVWGGDEEAMLGSGLEGSGPEGSESGPKSPNPYRAALALGDAFLATADSVSMVSDACSSGKPVVVLQDPGNSTPKHARFLAAVAPHLSPDVAALRLAAAPSASAPKLSPLADADEAAASLIRLFQDS